MADHRGPKARLHPRCCLAICATCTAEMCTATIVVSLPSLKSLIVRPSSTNASKRNIDGYVHTRSGKPISHRIGASRSHIQGGRMDDEVELVLQDRKPSPSPTRMPSGSGEQETKDAVVVTTDVIITREVI